SATVSSRRSASAVLPSDLIRTPAAENELPVNPEQYPPVVFPCGHAAVAVTSLRPGQFRGEQRQRAVGKFHDGVAGQGVMDNLQYLAGFGDVDGGMAQNACG